MPTCSPIPRSIGAEMDDSYDSPLSSLACSPAASSPLSLRFSKSPSPPCDYPSPSYTQISGSRSPSKSREPPLKSMDEDGQPPAKKRKLAAPKERTTEYLNLRTMYDTLIEEERLKHEFQLQRLLRVLHKKQKIVVIAGAGISVSAGIPDFRSSTGLFKTLRTQHKVKASGKHLFDASVYKTDSSTASFHDMVRELSHLTRNAQPTLFHHMLATLAEEGRLMRLYTQNVDGIDTSLKPLETSVPLNPKGPWPKTIQLHGGLEKMVCTKCGKLSDFDGALFEGPTPPSCQSCEEMDTVRTTMAGKRSHGIGRLRPRIVLYNEFNPDEEAIGAVTRADLRNRPDAVIVVGTSLKVPGVRRIAREMCAVTRGRRDGFTAWINNDPEPVGVEFKDCWDLVVQGNADEVARQAAIPKWDDKYAESHPDMTGVPLENVKSEFDVVIPNEIKHMALEKAQGILTPMASPRNSSPAPKKPLGKVKQLQLSSKGLTSGIPLLSKNPQVGSAGLKKNALKKKALKKATTTKPVNKLTNAFTTTKAIKVVSIKSTKAATREDSSPLQPVAPLFPNLAKAALYPMRPISPGEVGINSDFKHDSEGESGRNFEPYSPSHQQPPQRETISPKGNLPSGMSHLLD